MFCFTKLCGFCHFERSEKSLQHQQSRLFAKAKDGKNALIAKITIKNNIMEKLATIVVVCIRLLQIVTECALFFITLPQKSPSTRTPPLSRRGGVTK